MEGVILTSFPFHRFPTRNPKALDQVTTHNYTKLDAVIQIGTALADWLNNMSLPHKMAAKLSHLKEYLRTDR